MNDAAATTNGDSKGIVPALRAIAAGSPAVARGTLSPRVVLQFDHASRIYQPHENLGVRYRIEGIDDEKVRAVERSAVWYTEGKGEEDLESHFFERLFGQDAVNAAVPNGSFAIVLPSSPLSYEGVIVKVRWCVRVRIFFEGGKDFVSEHVFEIGQIPPARNRREPLA
ncbi:MAG: hypothetical protein WCQ91_00625 [Planctomycetota bacterium]